MPPDPLRKKQLFSEARTNGHQFFFTTGWKERFAQKIHCGLMDTVMDKLDVDWWWAEPELPAARRRPD